MNDQDQKQLGKTLWNIADQLRGAMNADDFRDYMLSFLFLRYLSDNYETAAKKELGRDYPDARRGRPPRAAGALVCQQPGRRRRVREADAPQGALRHPAAAPLEQHRQPGPHPERRTAQHAAGGLQIHRKRILREHLPRPVLRDQPRLGQARQDLRRPERQALHHHPEDRRRAGGVLHRHRRAGRCLRIPDRPVCRRFRQEGGRVLHPAADFRHPLRHRHPRQPGTQDRQERPPGQRARLRLRFRLAAAQRAQAHGAARHRQDLRPGKEHHHLQPRAHEHAAARGEGHGVRNLPRRHPDQRLGHAARD